MVMKLFSLSIYINKDAQQLLAMIDFMSIGIEFTYMNLIKMIRFWLTLYPVVMPNEY